MIFLKMPLGFVLSVVMAIVAAPAHATPNALYQRALTALTADIESERHNHVCGFQFQPDSADPTTYRFENGSEWFFETGEAIDLEETGLPVAGHELISLRSSMFESHEPPQFLREEDGVSVFAVSTDEFTISSMGHEVNLADHLMGEVGVDQQSARFVFVRYYAIRSFKPAPIARFRSFDHRVDVASAWEGGPLVRVRQRTAMRVSAMFQNHEIDETSAFTEFTACPAGN